MSKFEALISGPPDRENVVFEIWCENRQFAEISKEPGRGCEIEIYADPEGAAWRLDLSEFKAMLEDGIKELASNH